MCLESIVQQHLSDYEVIMVDDGSTDGSGAICDEYATKYPQFRVVRKENGGVAAARNLGIKEAKGEYIMFLDSDDFLIPDSMLSLLELAQVNKLDVLGFGHCTVPEDATVAPSISTDEQQQIKILSGEEYIANYNYTAQVWWYLVRRELIVENDIKFPVGHMLEDAAFNVRLFSRAQRMAQVPNAIYCYRQRSESIMHNRDMEHQQRLMWDYLYAASDVDKVLNDVGSDMNIDCYNRCRSRRDSYVLFGAIRAFKLGKVREYLQEAERNKLYPFKRLSEVDYPGAKFKLLHWLVTKPRLWKLLSSIYCIFR